MTSHKLGKEKKVGTTVPGWTEELGSRLGVLVSKVGGNLKAGEIAGVSDEMISRYINGRARPNIFAIAALVRAAHASLDWLMFNEQPEAMAAKTKDVERWMAIKAAVEQVFGDVGVDVAHDKIGSLTSATYGQLWDLEDEAEFRGGLHVALNAMRRNLADK